MIARKIHFFGALIATALIAQPSGADLLWSWGFDEPEIGTGAGTFTTSGTLGEGAFPADGSYSIVGFSASDNSGANTFSGGQRAPDGSTASGDWSLSGSPTLTISEGSIVGFAGNESDFFIPEHAEFVGNGTGPPSYDFFEGEGFPEVRYEMEPGGDFFISRLVIDFLEQIGGGSYFDRVSPLGNPDRSDLARALDALREGFGSDERFSPLFETLDGIEDDADLAEALGELSPARLEKTLRTVMELSDHFHSQIHRNVFDNIPSRIVKRGGTGVRHASLWNAFSAAGLQGVDVASGPDAAGHADAEIVDSAPAGVSSDGFGGQAGVSSGDFDTPAVSAARPGTWHAFVESVAGYGTEDAHDERIGQRWWATGIQAGADYAMSEEMVVGFAGGYSYTDASERGGSSEGNVHTGRFGPYVGFARGDWVLDAGTSFGLHWIDDERTAFMGGRSKSEHDAWDFAMHGSFRFDWEVGSFRFGPVTQMHFVRVEEDAYTEKSGMAPLRIDDRETDSLSSTVGLHAAWAPPIPELDLVIDGEIGWVHEFLDDAETISARFAGAPGTDFRTRLPEADRDGVRLSLGADIGAGERWRVRLGWDGAFTSHVADHTATLRFQTFF